MLSYSYPACKACLALIVPIETTVVWFVSRVIGRRSRGGTFLSTCRLIAY